MNPCDLRYVFKLKVYQNEPDKLSPNLRLSFPSQTIAYNTVTIPWKVHPCQHSSRTGS